LYDDVVDDFFNIKNLSIFVIMKANFRRMKKKSICPYFEHKCGAYSTTGKWNAFYRIILYTYISIVLEVQIDNDK